VTTGTCRVCGSEFDRDISRGCAASIENPPSPTAGRWTLRTGDPAVLIHQCAEGSYPVLRIGVSRLVAVDEKEGRVLLEARLDGHKRLPEDWVQALLRRLSPESPDPGTPSGQGEPVYRSEGVISCSTTPASLEQTAHFVLTAVEQASADYWDLLARHRAETGAEVDDPGKSERLAAYQAQLTDLMREHHDRGGAGSARTQRGPITGYS
jgi:hypothetical protein